MKNILWKHSHVSTGSAEEAELAFPKLLHHRWGWDAVAVRSRWSHWWDPQPFICRKPVHCEPLFALPRQRILPLEQGMKPLSSLDFRKPKTQWEIKVLFGLGIWPYYIHWWQHRRGFVCIVPRRIEAKLLFVLVEITRPPRISKFHKCKLQLAAPCCPAGRVSPVSLWWACKWSISPGLLDRCLDVKKPGYIVQTSSKTRDSLTQMWGRQLASHQPPPRVPRSFCNASDKPLPKNWACSRPFVTSGQVSVWFHFYNERLTLFCSNPHWADRDGNFSGWLKSLEAIRSTWAGFGQGYTQMGWILLLTSILPQPHNY